MVAAQGFGEDAFVLGLEIRDYDAIILSAPGYYSMVLDNAGAGYTPEELTDLEIIALLEKEALYEAEATRPTVERQHPAVRFAGEYYDLIDKSYEEIDLATGYGAVARYADDTVESLSVSANASDPQDLDVALMRDEDARISLVDTADPVSHPQRHHCSHRYLPP